MGKHKDCWAGKILCQKNRSLALSGRLKAINNGEWKHKAITKFKIWGSEEKEMIQAMFLLFMEGAHDRQKKRESNSWEVIYLCASIKSTQNKQQGLEVLAYKQIYELKEPNRDFLKEHNLYIHIEMCSYFRSLGKGERSTYKPKA